MVANKIAKCVISIFAGDLDRKKDQLLNCTTKLRTLKSELKQTNLALENTQKQLAAVSSQHSKSVIERKVHHVIRVSWLSTFHVLTLIFFTLKIALVKAMGWYV